MDEKLIESLNYIVEVCESNFCSSCPLRKNLSKEELLNNNDYKICCYLTSNSPAHYKIKEIDKNNRVFED